MSRLSQILKMYIEEVEKEYDQSREKLEAFNTLLGVLQSLKLESSQDSVIYRQILKKFKMVDQLTMDFEKGPERLRKYINNFLTIMLCFELISKQYRIKAIFHKILSLDCSPLHHYVYIHNAENKLLYLNKEIFLYIDKMSKNLSKHHFLAGSKNKDDDVKRIESFFSYLKKNHYLNYAHSLLEIMEKKLGSYWSSLYFAKLLSYEREIVKKSFFQREKVTWVTTLLNSTDKFVDNNPLWNPMSSNFIADWRNKLLDDHDKKNQVSINETGICESSKLEKK